MRQHSCMQTVSSVYCLRQRCIHHSRKEEQIANQKRQIKRLQDDMTGLVSEATVADLQDQVEDKEDFIKQLEQEIEDIEKKLAE